MRSAAGIILAVALVVALPHRAQVRAGGDGEEGSPARAHVARILADESIADPAVLGSEIAAQGPGIAPVILEALRTRTIAGAGEDTALGSREERALLEAARRLGRSSFLPLFEGENEEPDPATRRAFLQVLGAVGRTDDVERLFALATAEPVSGSGLVEAFEGAVAGFVARDASVLTRLRSGFFSIPPEYATGIARVVGEAPGVQGVEWLADLLTYRPELDPSLLSLVAKAARRSPAVHEEEMLEKVRGFLLDTDLQVQRQAAMTVATLGDFGAVEPLCELLASPDEVVRQSAHWGLREITGLGLPADPAGWRAWLDAERTWYEKEAQADLDRLVDHRSADIAEALVRLGKHRYERHRTRRSPARHTGRWSSSRARTCRSIPRPGARR